MLTNGNCAANRLQFDDRRPFVKLAFEKIEILNYVYSILIGHLLSILCEIVVRYGSVTPNLRCKNLYGRRQKFYHT